MSCSAKTLWTNLCAKWNIALKKCLKTACELSHFCWCSLAALSVLLYGLNFFQIGNCYGRRFKPVLAVLKSIYHVYTGWPRLARIKKKLINFLIIHRQYFVVLVVNVLSLHRHMLQGLKKKKVGNHCPRLMTHSNLDSLAGGHSGIVKKKNVGQNCPR